MKKAVSIFLAVVMAVITLPYALAEESEKSDNLGVSAEAYVLYCADNSDCA